MKIYSIKLKKKEENKGFLLTSKKFNKNELNLFFKLFNANKIEIEALDLLKLTKKMRDD